MWTGRPIREIADLSDGEHEALLEALNDKVQASSWDHQTELLARSVDLLGAILAQLQAGILTANPKNTRGFGAAKYPDPVERPEWVTSEKATPDVEVVSLAEAAAFMTSN